MHDKELPNTALPAPYHLTLMVILLFVDDFCLIASSPVQLLTMMLTAQTWFENTRGPYENLEQ